MDFETAFDRHHDAVYRYLHRLTGDPDQAEELAQETFVRLLENEVSPDKVKGWLFTVATNLVRDRARTRDRRDRLKKTGDVFPEAPPGPDEVLARGDRKRKVRRALGRLRDREREMLMMREEGFSYAEIAETLGVARSSVGKLLSRSLERFAREFRKEGGEG